ncbi:MAG: hypothetical protein A2365_03610 [Candidatus Nealsonbacteria bacterium RIFOXYB1_FULL_40_15]|uniref:Outer membrane protein beta-barrel domain-containing protein n=2 Tax=Candidatus Nealsoniibacteriota TaxID=1817911 RepID=A0A1G2ERJ0_9BACT|nr:MAG: hypothetical protein A2365_03610 [Candidatus Nealsonbacteria bacterium RIFOXYB1_FULL_40_15]OGZ28389.1 MAG: hypothetical protein A2427_01295 [Candidatus Nealsonbacteria bacterium RIFOXYC1_FULL_40_7]OGZ29514.1 MAG: hypothetical protein A2562_02380 [Candidatus Nealsonbacteria bacterium RIFOXYD1_FULL_39_11]
MYRIFVLLAVLVAGCNTKVSFQYSRSFVEGSLQTPCGGKEGTSSSGRPTLKEIGIEDVETYGGSVYLNKGRHTGFFKGTMGRASGECFLGDSLISQNKSFLEGEKLFSDLAFDTLAFGYLYDIREGKVRLSPGADLSVLMFHYKLSDGVGLVDRSYSKASVRVGGVAGIELGDFTLELEGFYSFPLDNSPEINEINLSLIYPVVQGDDFTLEASAGVGLREIKYEDNQDFPNKIEIDQCPIIVLGLRLGF